MLTKEQIEQIARRRPLNFYGDERDEQFMQWIVEIFFDYGRLVEEERMTREREDEEDEVKEKN